MTQYHWLVLRVGTSCIAKLGSPHDLEQMSKFTPCRLPPASLRCEGLGVASGACCTADGKLKSYGTACQANHPGGLSSTVLNAVLVAEVVPYAALSLATAKNV